MHETVALPASPSESASPQRLLLRTSWAIVLLLTVPQIILGAFMGQDVAWLGPARLILLATILVLSFTWPRMRPLRGMVIVFLVIYGAEEWFFLGLVQHNSIFAALFGDNANLAFVGQRLLRLGAVLVMLLVLLAMGLKRQDFFLRAGNLNAVAEPERWGVPRKPETWPGLGGRYALIIVTLFLIFMVPALQPSLNNLSAGLVLFAALCALMNAFAEEFLYRAALLSQMLPLFGKGASMMLAAAWFGLGHYFGVPYGITGVILTGIGGWIFAKSMIETRGMGWALLLHFVSDFTIFIIILLAGGF